MRRTASWLFVGCLAATAPALGGELFVGAGVGSSDFEQDLGGLSAKADDVGYKVFVGGNFLKFVGIEGGYVDFGSFDDTVTADSRVEGKARALAVFGVARLPVGPRLSLFGKFGLAAWDSESGRFSTGPPPLQQRSDDDGVDVAWGLGVRIGLIPKVGLRAEWEVFEVDSLDKLRMGSISAEIRF